MPPTPALPTGGRGRAGLSDRAVSDQSDQAGGFICGAGERGFVFAGEEARAGGGGHWARGFNQDAGADFGGFRSP